MQGKGLRVLVVDDEPQIQKLLKVSLGAHGYEMEEALTGEAGIRLAAIVKPDFLLVDLGLPDMDGKAVVAAIRDWSQAPIIVLTARDQEQEKIDALDAGADDYVTKPFNPLEVMARVKSLLRRTKMQIAPDQPDVLEVNALIINKDSHEVKTIDGKEIQLTALEFGILYLLASHPNRVFSADEIFERVWKQESIVSAKTVMVHVSHLRDKIEEATGGEKVIQTVWGVGYKIDAR